MMAKKVQFYFNIGVIFFIIIFLSAFFRFSKPQFPLFVPDSGAYFSTSLNYFINGEVRGNCARSFPYPIIILTIIKVFKNLSFISFFQHISGILAGILLFFTLQGQLKFTKFNKGFQYLPYIIIFFFLIVFLFLFLILSY